jgi:hypothetical protein
MTKKNHFVIKLLLVAVLPVLLMFGLASTVKHADAAYLVTGVYKGNDGGIYYVRQIGNTLWWLGMGPNDGHTWTNVFSGQIFGNYAGGTWTDLPRGQNQNAGGITIEILTPDSFKETSHTGGFGGTLWQRLY